jgi:hypothetical protein
VPTTWDCSGPRQSLPGIPSHRLLLISRNTVSHTDVRTACLRHNAFQPGRFRGVVKLTPPIEAAEPGLGSPGPYLNPGGAARCCWTLTVHGVRRIDMKRHSTLPLSSLSRRSVLGAPPPSALPWFSAAGSAAPSPAMPPRPPARSSSSGKPVEIQPVGSGTPRTSPSHRTGRSGWRTPRTTGHRSLPRMEL